MPNQTEQERNEMMECGEQMKENAKVFREAAEKATNKKIKSRLESVAASFSVNAKILEAEAKSVNPSEDKYQKLFPNLQKE